MRVANATEVAEDHFRFGHAGARDESETADAVMSAWLCKDCIFVGPGPGDLVSRPSAWFPSVVEGRLIPFAATRIKGVLRSPDTPDEGRRISPCASAPTEAETGKAASEVEVELKLEENELEELELDEELEEELELDEEELEEELEVELLEELGKEVGD